MSTDTIISRSITASRHQQDANVQGVQTIIPYHEILIRPSGQTTDIVLINHSILILLSIFGGVGFILYLILTYIPRKLAYLNIRIQLAK